MARRERLRRLAEGLLPRSFNQQVAVLSALSLVVGLAVFGFVIHRKQQALIEASALIQAQLVARNFSVVAHRDILLANYDELRELMGHTAEFPEVRRLVVTDRQGRILTDVVHPRGGPVTERFEARGLVPPTAADQHVQQLDEVYRLWEPVGDQGWVYMEFDYSAQSRRYGGMLRAEVGTGLLLAVFSALYFLGLLHRPIRQLRRLIGFAQGLDVYHQQRREIHVGSGTREIRQLNEALNQSAARLFEQSQKLLQSEAQYRRVMNSVREVIFESDLQGRFTFLNPAWEELTGYPVRESLGRAGTSFVHPDDREQARELLLPFLRQAYSSTELECRAVARDGRELWIQLRATLLYDDSGLPSGISGTINDITTRKEAEAALIAAKEAAESATQAKSQFLATMSHEIRTPMNGVLGMAQLLGETDLSPEQRDYVRTLYHSGQALLTIINDILDFSKIEAGKLSIESVPFDLGVLVDEACDLLLPQLQEKRLELVQRFAPDCPRLVQGDLGRIRQILLNYLSNAAKFTAQGHVFVDVRAESVIADEVVVRIAITDTGIGIPREKQSRLFEQFTQADPSMTRRFGGTGLGLAICKALAALMGGHVGLESDGARGSTFFVVLPLRRQAAYEPRPDTDGLRGLHVLVVDDLELSRRVLRETLAAQGVRVSEAGSLQEALAVLQAAQARGEPVRIALLDHALPDGSGETLAAHLHADPALRLTRLVLLAGGPQRQELPQLHGAGFAAVLAKPVRSGPLLAELRQAVAIEAPAPPQAAPVAAPPRLPAHLRVLLAEDNAVNQKVAARMLEKMGARVDVAATGLEAVRMCQQRRYDLVLMDCQMPEMDGYAATREIRRLPAAAASARSVPVIALTANTLEGDRERCLACGMDDFLGKPIRQEDLFAALLRHAPAGCRSTVSTG